MKVSTEIAVYEVDGKASPMIDGPKLTVESHWNRDALVVLAAPNGATVTVAGSHLVAAIANARNWHR
jgi:hypothetical protein